MTQIRTLIVDDERLARKRILRMLSDDEEFTVVAECSSAHEALEAMSTKPVDLLYLDVQMPQMDGFTLLENLGREKLPMVVFVTAFDEHAVRAFDYHAIDYLLKPFDEERFSRSKERVKKQIAMQRSGKPDAQIRMLLEELRHQRLGTVRFPVKTPGRVFFVKMEDIDWIEAADNYVTLHVGTDNHLLRETMTSIENKLDPERFLRIHRSAIVNVDRIKELRPFFHGEYMAILKDGTQLTLSRSYREKILAVLGT